MGDNLETDESLKTGPNRRFEPSQWVFSGAVVGLATRRPLAVSYASVSHTPSGGGVTFLANVAPHHLRGKDKTRRMTTFNAMFPSRR